MSAFTVQDDGVHLSPTDQFAPVLRHLRGDDEAASWARSPRPSAREQGDTR